MKKLILFCYALIVSNLLISQNSISTYPANTANNGNAGITFELEVHQAITLDELWSQTSSAGTSNVTFWYKPGSYFGLQTVSTANGWIQVSTGVSATGGGNASPPVLFVGNINLLLQPGKYGIHMTTSNCGYKTWVTGSQDVFTDTYVTIRNGTNYGYGGGVTNGNHPRQLCGIVKYTPLASVPNDAGVTSIDSPASFCSGVESIVATIRNFGTNQVNPVTVNWSVNGFTQTPVLYNQLLDTLNGLGSQTAQVTLGNWSFTSGQTDTIAVWTSLPNGQLDTVNQNDTVVAFFQPSLSGTFTIDTGSTADYNTFSQAAQDLSNFGVCGPVVFNVGGNIYNEQVVFDEIEGVSSINTVTFIGDSGVTIQFSSTLSTANYVVQLNGADWVTFDNININGIGATYGAALELATGSDNNTFMNCVIQTNTGSTSSNMRAIYIPSGGNQNYNKFYNNRLIGGYYCVYNYGSSTTSPNMQNEFIGNSFEDYYYYGMYNYYNQDMKINNNKFRTNRNNASTYGIHSYYSYGNAEVIGNDINIPGTYGLYLYYHDGDPNNNALIANNMVRIGRGAGTTGYGMILLGTFAKVINNTFIGTHSTYTYAGIYLNGGAFNTVLNNNIYLDKAINSVSYGALYYSSTTSAEVSDYNNVYINGVGNFGRFGASAYSTFSDWKTNTGLDTSSFNTDPMIANFDDPRTCSDTLDGAAMPLPYIKFDFEGDNRDPLTPDIGADEFIGSKSFSAGPDGYVCSGKGVVIGLHNSGLDSVAWSTGDTTTTIKVFNPGTYSVSVKSVCADTIQMDEVVVTDLTAVSDFDVTVDFITGKFEEKSVNKDSLVWIIHTTPADTFYSDDVTYLFPDKGPYDITLCVYNACDTVCTTKVWKNTVGITESLLGNGIRIMPNPATDAVNINFNGIEGDVTVELNNIQGQIVYTERYVNVGNSNRSINVSNLNKGMYILKFITNNEVATKQLIVQ